MALEMGNQILSSTNGIPANGIPVNGIPANGIPVNGIPLSTPVNLIDHSEEEKGPIPTVFPVDSYSPIVTTAQQEPIVTSRTQGRCRVSSVRILPRTSRGHS